MELGTFPTRFRGWPRGAALGLIFLLMLALIAAAWPSPSAPRPKVRASEVEQSDLQLYRDIVTRMRAGEPYYPVTADELRKGGYPLKPFVTFRLPTLASFYAHTPALLPPIVEGLLALGVLLAWWRRLQPHLPFWPLGIALVLMVAGTATLVEPVTGMFHESWAALLMALMIALRRPGNAGAAIAVGALALAIRETALPMIAAMGALALLERRWREASGWGFVVLLFAAALAWHAGMVSGVVRAGDLASPGWNALLGPIFALTALTMVSSAIALPSMLAKPIIVMSLFGWASVATQWALRASLLLLGYAAMLALFARADTFYWALLAAPLSLVGLAFVPRALSDLVSAGRGVAVRNA